MSTYTVPGISLLSHDLLMTLEQWPHKPISQIRKQRLREVKAFAEDYTV